MKKLITILIFGLLAINIYAGSSAEPTDEQTTQSYDYSNWGTPYGDVQSIEAGNVDKIIYNGHTAVKIVNVLGRYINPIEASIWGDMNALYTVSNGGKSNPSLLTIENYGNISSDYNYGLTMVGTQGQLNNHSSGTIFGGVFGILIDAENGSSPLVNGFWINNDGDIESTGTGIYALNNYSQAITIDNNGTIAADNYGILARSLITINNTGKIVSDNTAAAAIYLMDGGVVNNTNAIANNLGWGLPFGTAIRSNNSLVLQGNGFYEGDITYAGTVSDGVSEGNLRLDNTHVDFKNSRLRNWTSITVVGGENFFNVETERNTDVFVTGGAIVHMGDGESNPPDYINLDIIDGIVNPYENNYDYQDSGSGYWNKWAEQYEGGPKYYEKREYERLAVNNLTVSSNGAVVIDFKDAKPHDVNAYLFNGQDYPNHNHQYANGDYGGYGYNAFKGEPVTKYHKINHDTIDVKGTAYIAAGATLYLVDHTLESATESNFNYFNELWIDAFDGNIAISDFSNVELYSNLYGIESLDGLQRFHLTTDAYIPGQKGSVDWWVKQVSLGFADIPQIGSQSGSLAPMTVSAAKLPYEITQEYSAKITQLDITEDLQQTIYGFQGWNDIDAFMDSLNKLEYASLATSNLNLISNRVAAMYNRLGAGYDLRDANNVSVWGDIYFSNDSLDGSGDHGITGQGTEFAMGFDKLFNDKFTLGMSFNHTDYESRVNDSGFSDKIDSKGYGLNAYAMLEQGALSHKMMLGYAAYENTGDNASFDSDELFAAYRAEYTIKRTNFDTTLIAGVRYSKVKFDEMREDSENGLKAFDQDSLETELGVELSKQFKRLGLSVSGVWMHELLDSQTRAEAFTSFGDFSQKGIARDTDSFRATIGFEYQLTDKVTLDFDYAKELSDNSESDSVNGKITFRF